MFVGTHSFDQIKIVLLLLFRKSTLVRLLYRFFDPQKGNIYVNRQDIKLVDMDSLRQAIGVVPQVIILGLFKIFS